MRDCNRLGYAKQDFFRLLNTLSPLDLSRVCESVQAETGTILIVFVVFDAILNVQNF